MMTDYTQMILRSLFRDFIFDEKTRRIVIDFKSQIPSDLIEEGIRQYNYNWGQASDYVNRAIESIRDVFDVSNINNHVSLRLSELRPFSLLRIRHEGIALTLLHLEDYRFCLLKDDWHVLRTGDLLHCWTYSLSEGGSTVFRVFRSGKCYPDDRHLLKIDCIEAIEECTPVYLPLSRNNNRTHNVVMAKDIVFAWEPRDYNGGYAFLPQDFTTDKNAMFAIDLRQKKFSLNKGFDLSRYNRHGTTYLDIVKTVCYYTVEEEIEKRLLTLSKGDLKAETVNGNQYAMRVVSKAKVTL